MISSLFKAAALCAVSVLCALGAPAQAPADPFAPNGTGIGQIREIAGRLAKTLGDIPPDIERVALAQIRTDPSEFDAGMSRYIQAQVEETFRKDGRRTVVTSPELRTFRVVATDSSFKFTNSMQNADELWKLGEKLRVNGFIEGSCSKSSDNDVILNLKLFRHKSGEVVWSGSFVAGPNEKKTDLFDLEYSVSASVRRFPVKEAIFPRDGFNAVTGRPLEDTLSTFGLTQYALEATVAEKMTADSRLNFGVTLGYGYTSGEAILSDSSEVGVSIQTLKFGVEMLAVFFRKPNPDMGYWLGAYVGYQEFLPVLYRGRISSLAVGYRSRVSRHFTLGGGAMFNLFDNKLKGLQGDNIDRKFKLDAVAYELTFLHYTF